MANEHFTAETIVYDEESGLSVTCYTGDYLNVGKILPEDQQYGQNNSLLTLSFPCHS